ncbi:YdcF family protein [Paenibacillus sp. D51F]
MIYFVKFVYSLLLPPGLFLLLLGVAVWRAWIRDRKWTWLPLLLLVALYLMSSGLASDALVRSIESRYPQPSPADVRLQGDVLVVLGGGATPDTPDLEGLGNLSGSGEARLLAAVRLHAATGLPILFSGGQVFPDSGNEADIAGRQLRQLGVPAESIFLENRSLNTEQNAAYSKVLMEAQGFSRPVLVTSAFHMSRSVETFRQAGLTPLPYPVDYGAPADAVFYWSKLLPSGGAMAASSTALKEYLGMLALRLKG